MVQEIEIQSRELHIKRVFDLAKYIHLLADSLAIKESK
jgi:hypothetical protein